MKLVLKRPLAFIDLETTGVNPGADRIVEIAIVKVSPDGTRQIKRKLINPEMPIPDLVSKIHGIYEDDIKDKPIFKEVAKTIAQFIEGCDFAGFNSNRFDIPLLAEEFLRADIDIDLKKRKFIDVQAIYHKMEKRTLSAAYKFYCQKPLEDAHSAMADTKATYEVLKAQLDQYIDEEYEDHAGKVSKPIVNDIHALSEFSAYDTNVDFVGRIVYDEKGVEIINFGKNKGVPVEKVLREQPGYYGWIMNNEFPLYTKKVLTAIKLRMK